MMESLRYTLALELPLATSFRVVVMQPACNRVERPGTPRPMVARSSVSAGNKGMETTLNHPTKLYQISPPIPHSLHLRINMRTTGIFNRPVVKYDKVKINFALSAAAISVFGGATPPLCCHAPCTGSHLHHQGRVHSACMHACSLSGHGA